MTSTPDGALPPAVTDTILSPSIKINAFSIGFSLFPSISLPARMATRCGVCATATIVMTKLNKTAAVIRRIGISSLKDAKPTRDEANRRVLPAAQVKLLKKRRNATGTSTTARASANICRVGSRRKSLCSRPLRTIESGSVEFASSRKSSHHQSRGVLIRIGFGNHSCGRRREPIDSR